MGIVGSVATSCSLDNLLLLLSLRLGVGVDDTRANFGSVISAEALTALLIDIGDTHGETLTSEAEGFRVCATVERVRRAMSEV